MRHIKESQRQAVERTVKAVGILQQTSRTGWVDVGISKVGKSQDIDVESVAAHPWGSTMLILLYAFSHPGLFTDDQIFQMCRTMLFHDLGEATIGDISTWKIIPPDTLEEERVALEAEGMVTKQQKDQMEKNAFVGTVKGLPDDKIMIKQFEDFEKGTSFDFDMALLKDADKMDMVTLYGWYRRKFPYLHDRLDRFYSSEIQVTILDDLHQFLRLQENKKDVKNVATNDVLPEDTMSRIFLLLQEIQKMKHPPDRKRRDEVIRATTLADISFEVAIKTILELSFRLKSDSLNRLKTLEIALTHCISPEILHAIYQDAPDGEKQFIDLQNEYRENKTKEAKFVESIVRRAHYS